MFFLFRSGVCIALVFSALPDSASTLPAAPAAAAAEGGQLVSAGLTGLCHLAAERCAALFGQSLRSAVQRQAFGDTPPLAAPVRPSRDTLGPADRRPVWAGPVRPVTRG